MARPCRHVDAVVAATVLFASFRRARTQEVSSAEEQAFRLVNNAPDNLHVPVWAVMQSGSLAAVFVVSGELCRRGRVRSATASLLAGVGVWAGVKAVKPLVGRGRPSRHLDDVSVRGHPQTGLGYPSGHAAVATTLALVVSGDLGAVWRATTLVVAGLTGGARMYAGAHLPLDVVGGLAIGVLCGRGANAILSDTQSP